MKTHDNYANLKVYNVGIYLRLSREDEENGQSMSIKNQQDYIMNYVCEKGWNIIDIYADDGYSGLNFDRPNFKRMIHDIENKKIDLVITKDLSRLGRDYIDTGYYIERYFPQKHIRYIALSDGIDTFESSASNDMTPFKSVLNDMYAKDISKKIRIVMDTKRENGKFIGAFAPYGYVKSQTDRNMLVIDEEAAQVVRRIYSMYLSGYSMDKIAKILTEENILIPTEYKRQKQHLSYTNYYLKFKIWRATTIKDILSNPTYIGNLTQHKLEKVSYKLNKFKTVPRSDWVIVENTHEAIISRKDFETVQEMLKRKAAIYYTAERASHLFAGLIFCGDCKGHMSFRRLGVKKEFCCLCTNNQRFGKCHYNMIKEAYLNEFVINDLKDISSKIISDKEGFCKSFTVPSNTENDNQVKKETQKIQKRLNEIKMIIKSLYEDKVRKVISEEDFLLMSSEFNSEKEKISKRLLMLGQTKKQEEKQESPEQVIEAISKIVDFENLSPLLMGQLIDRIEVFKPNKIVVKYKFKNPYMQ